MSHRWALVFLMIQFSILLSEVYIAGDSKTDFLQAFFITK